MSTTTLNLGVLAHVDAGKTSLTERLLFDAGVIPRLGSVDAGDTQTDLGDVERRRGITIRAAVASFSMGDLQINLVDTPGHPDFIAEVERALSVLDGAVLVVSAVEGVQAQTRVLMRSLQRMRLPTLIFVNKVDRTGAQYDDLLVDMRRRLTPLLVPMTEVDGLGERCATARSRSCDDEALRVEVAELLADHDDRLLERIVAGNLPGGAETRRRLRSSIRTGLVHPVFFGSALTGSGVSELMEGMRTLLPPSSPPSEDDALRGTVFAVARERNKEKVAYLRLFSGQLHERQRVTFRRRDAGGVLADVSGRITGLEVISGGGMQTRPGPLTAGNIARLHGLSQIRVGDSLGDPDGSRSSTSFSPPILESVVRSRHPGEEPELHAALTLLADEDPLIRTRTTTGGATSVLLYGAVQREVLQERLDREFGLEAVFESVQPVYLERPAGAGQALREWDPLGPNDFWQTVGIRIEPAPRGSGNSFTREAELGLLPRGYHRAIADAAMAALREGLYGWEVTDCAVFLTSVGYDPPMTVAGDFRDLTPMVVLQALRSAGTDVYEPCYRLEVEIPDNAVSGVIGALASLGADIASSTQTRSAYVITAEIPARSLQVLATALPGLTSGEGMIAHERGSDRRVRGPVPSRKRP